MAPLRRQLIMKRASDGGEDCRKKSKANDGGEDCAKSAIFDVFVTARFPTSSDDEVATALYRIELLNDADLTDHWISTRELAPNKVSDSRAALTAFTALRISGGIFELSISCNI